MSADEESVYIYVLRDPRTNEVRYVGQTENPEKRIRLHILADRNTHRDKWITELKEHGFSPFMQIIETCKKSEWIQKEQFYIQLYREQGCNLTNLTDGGDGKKGYQTPPETIRRLSESHKGQVPRNRKPVLQYSLEGKFMRRWESASDPAKEGYPSQGNISACCLKRRKTAGGYMWCYDEE